MLETVSLVNDEIVCSLKKNTHAVLTVPVGGTVLSTRMWDDISTSYYTVIVGIIGGFFAALWYQVKCDKQN